MRRSKLASGAIFHKLSIGLAVAACTIVAAAAAARAQSAFYACENKKTGDIRIISTNGPCKATEELISWTSGGTPGPSGATGPQGPVGPPGPPGPTGPAEFSGTLQTQIVSHSQVICACECEPAVTVCPLTVTSLQVEAQCPTGEVALGGGFGETPALVPDSAASPTVIAATPQPLQVTQSAPSSTGAAWDVKVAVPEAIDVLCIAPGICTNVTSWAVCAPGTTAAP